MTKPIPKLTICQQRGWVCPMDSLSKWFAAGVRAYRRGVEAKDCPLDEPRWKAAWLRGWKEAEFAKQEKINAKSR